MVKCPMILIWVSLFGTGESLTKSMHMVANLLCDGVTLITCSASSLRVTQHLWGHHFTSSPFSPLTIKLYILLYANSIRVHSDKFNFPILLPKIIELQAKGSLQTFKGMKCDFYIHVTNVWFILIKPQINCWWDWNLKRYFFMVLDNICNLETMKEI